MYDDLTNEEIQEINQVIDSTPKQDAKVIAFRASPYMQVTSFAIETHLHNLINTYGQDAVLDVMGQIVLRKGA